jgi:xanthine dehydrogenase YagS FAD-binding subunit
MKSFDYVRALDTQQATQQASLNSHYIAGGTNLLDLMKHQIETPIKLVDISRLPLTDVEDMADGGLKIGALVTNSDLAAHPRVIRDYPVLSRALLAGASGQLRNKATTGGNLLQRTRCYYFYAPDSACNKRIPNSGCPAQQGANRMHAILGTSSACIAQHPSDMAVAMRALDAQVLTQKTDGSTRQIDLADFYLLPAQQPERENVLEQGELITHVILPPAPKGMQQYQKVRDRASYAFAMLSIALVVDGDAEQIRDIRLAFGGIGSRPWRDPAVEALLIGKKPSIALFQQAADLLLAEAKGSGDNDFKIPLTRRTLTALLQNALLPTAPLPSAPIQQGDA